MIGKGKLEMRVFQTYLAFGMTFVLTCLITTTALARDKTLIILVDRGSMRQSRVTELYVMMCVL